MSGRFDVFAYHDPRPVGWVIHALGVLNRHVVLPHILRLDPIDLPEADVARLRAILRPGSAVFLGPNHPEFMTDWMIDKEISRRVSPRMAHWASYEIVNIQPLVQRFWLANNLIANAPGGRGKEYSIAWARRGHGVLLHPEGTATWNGAHVAELVPGIVDMAWESCRDGNPVHIAPLVWRIVFPRDVGAELNGAIGRIERGLGLPAGRGLPLAPRFAALLRHLLERRAERFGFPLGAVTDATFFADQARFAAWLLADLETRHGPTEGTPGRRIHALRGAVRASAKAQPERAREDRMRIFEIERLGRFGQGHDVGPTLTQERIAETLQQTRVTLLTRGFRNAIHNVVPRAVAPRAVHARAPEPIAVHEVFGAGGDEAAARSRLLETLRTRLQTGLDALGRELDPLVDPWRQPNPFHTTSTGEPEASPPGV